MWGRAILVAGAGALAALVRAHPRVAVRGTSMLPGLRPGDRLLVRRTRRLTVGGLAVVRDPRERGRWMVKRVVARSGNAVEVRGDNPLASTDSRTFGPVPPDLIVGRPIYRYHPPGRAGRVR